MIDWVLGERVAPPMPVWLPVCAAFVVEPMLADYSTNGLASGNHPVEATLHALYEVIERDAMAGLLRGGLTLPRGESRVVDLDTLPAGPLASLRDRLARAGIAVTLVRVASSVPERTFWAAFVDPDSPAACTSVNIGHGTHLNPTVAAIRAITEVAGARLTFIHGAREDPDSRSLRIQWCPRAASLLLRGPARRSRVERHRRPFGAADPGAGSAHCVGRPANCRPRGCLPD